MVSPQKWQTTPAISAASQLPGQELVSVCCLSCVESDTSSEIQNPMVPSYGISSRLPVLAVLCHPNLLGVVLQEECSFVTGNLRSSKYGLIGVGNC